jgi:hypothetical protein
MGRSIAALENIHMANYEGARSFAALSITAHARCCAVGPPIERLISATAIARKQKPPALPRVVAIVDVYTAASLSITDKIR